ncbi:cell wall-binding repeat-containing protein [Ornithinimicrobium avium]|uniref:alpha-amylase n=1 Tax=Ornithinimicrobium avium TaxID=2283195 RepID=A0A345NNT9_9MICO|nr:cell wall-binding repeat-containing protein [Ornithinimicrobium avium]AXH96697.1 peptidase S8 [Ornithinimicrobium avium]
MTHARGRVRRWLAGLAGVSLLVPFAGATAAAQPGPVPATPDSVASVEADVQQLLDTKGAADFWVHFEDRPDSSQLRSIDDWDARGKAVVEALTETAEESQAQVRALLDAEGVDYDAYWATNAIRVAGGDGDLVAQLVQSPEVDGIYAPRVYDIPDEKTEIEPADVAPSAVEWGVSDINADDVWTDYGVTGEGLVVASIDTGVQYDHPALVEHYRGNNGDGSFDHDYNWFDPQGGSPTPTDYNGHGSHVTGTMVGDDGAGNQIGVAPGAKWIAAAGCCPTDQALIDSGQWMLAPTRVDGSAPDPSKRPNVINNSWGTELPSNDPFMEDIIVSWTDAGIFGVFANGNSGPACETSGAPGSRIVAYSVGNYTSSHGLAGSSSRGAGQDGEIKPNISAPGTNIRSSVPGNGYANYTGTSMATPHVAGAVALLWSAAPSLVGDVEGTRLLLDGAAIDTDYPACGGTLEDNNGFGEGRMDVLATVQAAPIGDTGVLEGTVTDGSDGEPVAGATIVVDGELDRTLTTGADGTYDVLLTTGDYDVSASKFGYSTDSASVTITKDATTTQDFALQPSPRATVTGTVTDGSGRGWPLYAKVGAVGTGVFTYTDPVTGDYALDLPVGATYQLQFVAEYPGYDTQTRDVLVDGDTTEDAALAVNAESCTAPGYTYATDGVIETFDGTDVPEGWTVVDDAGTEQVWRFDDPKSRGNRTGGEGGFAITDSDYYGSGGAQDTSLVSPSVDMSELSDPAVGFKHDYNAFLGSGESGTVELSIDGGTTWTEVASYTSDTTGEVALQLPDAAGESEVQVRFRYQGSWDYWWEVDDVFVGNRACVPTDDGGLLVGNVLDGNTGEGVVGARVSNADETASAVTVATPADENLADGFYWLFDATTGEEEFTAEARNYSSVTQSVTTVENDTVRLDFELGAAFLEWTPESIDTEVTLGGSATEELTVTNTGTGEAEVELREVPGDFVQLRADGSTMTRQEIMDADGAEVVRLQAPTSFAQQGRGTSADQAPATVPAEAPWTDLGAFPTVVMDNRVVNLDGTWYSIGGTDGTTTYDTVARYDNEAMAWVQVAPLPIAASAVTTGVVDGRIVVAGGWVASGVSAQTFAYDAGADSWTEMAPAPAGFSAAGQAVVDGKLYSVGGCTTGDCLPMASSVFSYDLAADTWAQVADYPQAAAFASCGGIDGALYCTGGNDGAAATASTFAYDTGSDTWTAVADAPVDTWASQYAAANGTLVVNGGVQAGEITNATIAYDPAADAWSSLPASNAALYRGAGACGFARVGGSSGNFDAVGSAEVLPGLDECGASGADVEWLELSQTTATLAPGDSVTVEVTTDGDVAQPGTYTASVRIVSNAPGSAPEVPVTMVVGPALTWGKLTGTVSGLSCEGAATPLPGAGVDISPYREGFPGWFLTTGPEGSYATWFDTRVGAAEVTATKDGYRPESADVTVPRGETVTQDFGLLDTACQPVQPEPGLEVERVGGENRYGTAALLAEEYASPDVVFVASGQSYADALSAAARAGSVDSPVLLTRSTSLPRETALALQVLDAASVVVVGGPAAVSASVYDEVDALTGDVPISRLMGDDRYGTAAAISGQFDAASTVFVASGLDYPDALAAAARAGDTESPVLLVRQDRVPAATVAELTRLAPEQIVLMGGTTAVSEAVQESLGAYGTVTRVGGDDRYETAALLAESIDTSARVFVASGRGFADALSGAAVAGRDGAPMLLTRPDSLPRATADQVSRLQPELVTVVGGETAITEVVLDALRAL